jgi:HK97 gp10 family phage protein
MSFLTAATLQNNLAPKLAAWKRAAIDGNKAGVAAGAEIFESHAKENAPVLTGRLRDGIHTETVLDTDTQQQLMVTPVVAADNPYGFDPPYARRIELGFIGVDSLGRHYHQAPQPYMRPAFDENKDEAASAHATTFKSTLQGAA